MLCFLLLVIMLWVGYYYAPLMCYYAWNLIRKLRSKLCQHNLPKPSQLEGELTSYLIYDLSLQLPRTFVIPANPEVHCPLFTS